MPAKKTVKFKVGRLMKLALETEDGHLDGEREITMSLDGQGR